MTSTQARLACRALFLGLLVAMSAFLAGCSYIYGEDGLLPRNENNYQAAPELRVIEVPAGVIDPNLEPIYPIPATRGGVALSDDVDVPRPTPLTAGNQADAVRIQSLGDESWALVAVSPGQLWPQVRAFLTASAIGIASSDARAGLIDTQFVTLTDRPLPTRFRFRVDGGVQRNTSELHILQQDQSTRDQDWPPASSDAELERTMLQNIAQFIANSADTAPVSMMADRAMGDDGRIELEDNDVVTRLRLSLPFNRAWASVNKALPPSGFAIDDRDRSQGLYYLTFTGDDAEEASGWLDWLWGDEEGHPLAGRQYLLKVAALEPGTVYINLLDPSANPADRKESQALLNLLKGNIN